MDINPRVILVPVDFSEVANCAVRHALRIAHIVNGRIVLLHVVVDSNGSNEAQQRLEAVQHDLQQQGVCADIVLRQADNVAQAIAQAVREAQADVVVMGSEAIKHAEDGIMSHTLSTLSVCPVPVLVIQTPPLSPRYDSIVFPIDHTLENRDKHDWISYFCDNYLSHFYLIKPSTDSPQLSAKVDMNMASAMRFLDEHGARYTVQQVPGQKPYADEVLEAAVNIRADLIVLMTTPLQHRTNEPLPEQRILAQAYHIPVMCINSDR